MFKVGDYVKLDNSFLNRSEIYHSLGWKSVFRRFNLPHDNLFRIHNVKGHDCNLTHVANGEILNFSDNLPMVLSKYSLVYPSFGELARLRVKNGS